MCKNYRTAQRSVICFLLLIVFVVAPEVGAQIPDEHGGRAVPTETKPAVLSETGSVLRDGQVAQPPELSVPPPPNVPLDLTPENNALFPLLIAPAPAPLPTRLAEPSPLNFQSASEVIKVIVGLVFMFALAYLAGTARVQALENKLRVTSVVTAGLPFIFLGVISHLPRVGILSAPILWELRPLLALGLGWIGFTTGFRFDSRLNESLAPGTAAASLITASIPFAVIVASCAVLLGFTEHSPANAVFLRDALMLGTAGAMTAYHSSEWLQAGHVLGPSPDRVASIVTLEQLAGFIGLLIVAAYFRPQDNSVAWHLPGMAWLFITLGMGTMIGGVIWGMLARTDAGPEFTVLILGSVSFAAGMASFLRLSPLVVCFIVGLILVNLPGTSKERIREALEHIEHPIYLLFLLIAGALWEMTAWQGWVLMLLFVPARLLGKWLGVKLCGQTMLQKLTAAEQRSLIFSPMGALSIAIVVNAQDLYFGPAISWMVTAVIGGAIVTEMIVYMASHKSLYADQLSGVY